MRRITAAFTIALIETSVLAVAPSDDIPSSGDDGDGGPSGIIIVYVDDDAPLGGDGLSWQSAMKFLQDGIARANEVGAPEIKIAQGLYKPDRNSANPDGTGDRTVRFVLDHTVINGGYAGLTGDDPNARDFELYPTVLSGDLVGDDLPGFLNREDNTFVLLENDTGGTVQLGGVVLAAAGAVINLWDGEGLELIQGIVRDNIRGIDVGDFSSAKLNDCVFSNNSEMAVEVSDYCYAEIDRCEFIGNGSLGGTAFQAYNGAADLRNSTFFGNGSPESQGGAVHQRWSSIACVDCLFIDNIARNGGAIHNGEASDIWCVNCRFEDNLATERGGAVYSHGASPISNLRPDFINCIFFRNEAELRGGAMYDLKSEPMLVNCTIVKNTSEQGAAFYTTGSSILRLRNSIIRHNSGGAFAGAGPRSIYYSNVLGEDGVGNITANPKFRNLEAGDLRLKSSSPCIDSGKKSYVLNFPGQVAIDFLGNARFVNHPGRPNTGSGSPPVDMGAYEFQP